MPKKSFVISYLFFLGVLFHNNLFSQNISETERNYHINVKQFNEFIDRFNYKTDFKGNQIDTEFSSKISRAEYISLLFNKVDRRFVQNDKEYLALKNSFIQEVASNNKTINKYSVKIIAEAKSQVIYKNQPQEISIFLTQETENNGVKWVILSVKANFLDLSKQDTSLLRFIPPTSNETNFISLKAALEDKFYQHYYTYSNFTNDVLSIFFFLLNTEQIKFQFVSNLVYHIFDVDGWYIKVNEFNRSTDNSGWLIDDLLKVDDYQQELNNLLF